MMTTPEKRKLLMLLVLPLLVTACSALGFYALGGGRNAMAAQAKAGPAGINPQLPDAHLPKALPENKLSLYDRAQKDSVAVRSHSAAGAFAALGWDTARFAHPAGSAEANEAKIRDRLQAINQQLSQPPPAVKTLPATVPDNHSEELKRVEQLLHQKQEEARTSDPQMAQLSAMLDKIQAIQHPEQATDALKPKTAGTPDSAFKAVPAIIDGNQKIATGGVVKLLLKDTIRINGMLLHVGQSLSGACTLTNQRLHLDIRNIRLGTSIIPVNLTVFALDGMPGIPAPEAELGEAAGQGSANALESMQFLSGDYSIGTQAATAGISAAKGLLGKKARKIRVKLKGGQAVLLRINKS